MALPVVVKVPLVGNVTLVAPVRVLVYAKLPDPVTVIAALFDTPVPPLAAGRVPVTPVVSGKPVRLVATPLAGVPSKGATRVNAVPLVVAPVIPPKAPALLYWT